jgi:putative glycosyltransferase (exosortase G-associated)
METIPTLGNFFILLKKKIFSNKEQEISSLPEITLIVPVYNQEQSLRRCIQSIAESNYEKNKIYVLLVNNMSTDDSFNVFCECQSEFSELTMNWLNSKQGKSKALNLALFNCRGKYVIQIDSDGVLQKDALRNMVIKFEENPDIHCMTGTIMTNPEMIDDTDNVLMKLLRKLEFFEYCQAFLAGRNFQSEYNNIFTLSGAFSAFRKSTILKTSMYNTDTVCEDTHVTFQIRDVLEQKIALCNDAIFYVDPIESVNRLYTQRQRWQRGEIEVVHMFLKNKVNNLKNVFGNFVTRLVMFDHTFAFPRMIWYFALICLGFMNYPFSLIIKAIIIMYALYVFSTLLLYICVCLFLKKFKRLRRYYERKWYLIFLLPLYNFVVFWFRFAGIINSINRNSTWKTLDLKDERQVFCSIVKKDFGWLFTAINKARNFVNYND